MRRTSILILVGAWSLSVIAQPILVQDPEMSTRVIFPCVPSSESPPWYKLDTKSIRVEAVIDPVKRRSNISGSLEFHFQWKSSAQDDTTLSNSLVVSNSKFGSVQGMLINCSKFVATGCIDSDEDYVYIADISQPTQGIGISCTTPLISPNGQYVLFSAPRANALYPIPAPCTFVLDLADPISAPYQVYPVREGTPGIIELEADEGDERWLRPPRQTIFDCQDSAGGARQRVTPAVWSPNGMKIAFVSRIKFGALDYISAKSQSWAADEIMDTLVILDFSAGLPFTRTISLTLDLESLSTDSTSNVRYRLSETQLDWTSEDDLELLFRSGAPRFLPNIKYRLFCSENFWQSNYKSNFLEVAERIDD